MVLLPDPANQFHPRCHVSTCPRVLFCTETAEQRLLQSKLLFCVLQTCLGTIPEQFRGESRKFPTQKGHQRGRSSAGLGGARSGPSLPGLTGSLVFQLHPHGGQRSAKVIQENTGFLKTNIHFHRERQPEGRVWMENVGLSWSGSSSSSLLVGA